MTFGYDGLGRRVTGTESGWNNPRYTIYDGYSPIGEVNRAGLSFAYTWGANGLVSENENGVSLWHAFGPQGETRQLTNSSAAVADSYVFTAYGEPVATSGAGDWNTFLYGGQVGYYSYAGGSLVQCGARWYDPYLARWLTRDPIEYAGGDNLYAYCKDNPVRGVDRAGTDGCADLLKEIIRLARELSERDGALGNDKQNLYIFARYAKAPGKRGTWKGHQDQYVDKQKSLKKKIQEYDDNCGGTPGAPQVPNDARDWAVHPVRDMPKPRRVPTDKPLTDETWGLVPALMAPFVRVPAAVGETLGGAWRALIGGAAREYVPAW